MHYSGFTLYVKYLTFHDSIRYYVNFITKPPENNVLYWHCIVCYSKATLSAQSMNWGLRHMGPFSHSALLTIEWDKQTIEVYIGLTWEIIATFSTSTQWKQTFFNNIVIRWWQTAESIHECKRNTLCKSCNGKVHSGIKAGLWTNMVRLYNLSMLSSCYYPMANK